MKKVILAVAVVFGFCMTAMAADEIAPAPAKVAADAKVYTVGEGKAVHLAECPVVVKAKETKPDSVKETTYAEAKEAGKTDCKRCIAKGEKKDKDADEKSAEDEAEAE